MILILQYDLFCLFRVLPILLFQALSNTFFCLFQTRWIDYAFWLVTLGVTILLLRLYRSIFRWFTWTCEVKVSHFLPPDLLTDRDRRIMNNFESTKIDGLQPINAGFQVGNLTMKLAGCLPLHLIVLCLPSSTLQFSQRILISFFGSKGRFKVEGLFSRDLGILPGPTAYL